MKIPTTLALKIVKDMKNIINQDLNFINTDGYIIASTNKKRIGTFHEASLKCIATKNEIIINNDNEYLGSKKGINIPVYLDNEIVGIIGITGERKNVEKYGKIIKSMTEILIKEAQIKELTIKKREKNRSIIETILFNYNKNLDFYISLTFPYTVIVGKTNDKIEDNNILYKAIEDSLPKDKKSIFTITSNYIIIFLNSIKKNYIENFIKFLQQNLNLNLKLDFKFGIGKNVEEIGDFISSYSEAKNSLKYISSLNLEEKYIFYSDLDLGIIFSDIQNEKIEEFINKIFKNLQEEEIKYFYSIFIAYKKNNGSIIKTAKFLFMHKNTLQYQLNKLYKLTGYNPRKLDDFSILDLAFMFKNFN